MAVKLLRRAAHPGSLLIGFEAYPWPRSGAPDRAARRARGERCGRGDSPSQARLQIVRRQTGALRDASQHARSDLVAIVECPDEVGVALPREDPVRAPGLALQRPADALEGR